MSGVALPPRFYTPSGFRISMWDSEDESSRPSRNINPERYFLPRTPKQQPPPSLSSNDPNSDNIDMMFQGAASEIDPDSSVGQAVHATLQSNPPAPSTIENGFAVRAMPEIQVSDRESREECDRIGPLNEHVLPHNSSSRLTDMLRVVSPSKTGYNDFYPEHPSAMPAPLYGSHVPPMTHSNMSPIPPSDLLAVPLADGRTILNHFYMINEHIDVLGRSMYDQVERQKDQQLAALEAQTRDVVTRLEQKIDDVKSTLSASLGEYIDRASNRHHAIDGKMNGLLDFVKAEVVGSLTSQSQKTAEMELGLKQLQKTVQDLQKTIESRVTLPAPVMPHGQYAAPPGLGAPQVGNLPHARSQPSLGVGFYDTANEMARDSNQRLPPVPEVRNEGRYRYGNPNPNGWQQHRSPNQGREGKENMYAFSSPPNPYNSSNGNGPYSGGYMGGYPGYFPGGQSDQGYNYSPSAK
ncbi:hypothetical protein P154DRAFT_623954 [Amniculicola lignicola CBS 123094]|uniref:Uncharacterized protein n=1 Tax=Amniculicola lignicola CBS 123094 TaxID=1392246 RepID=A0A6A5W354_9PLEO|nr:hypothetical protein P154DRAFT_623954 [Amniculicola lignicola CBS 123094]